MPVNVAAFFFIVGGGFILGISTMRKLCYGVGKIELNKD